MSNGLDADQDQQSVGPDLGPNCLQRLSADKLKIYKVNILFVNREGTNKLTLKAPITTAADDKFCDIFPYF